MNTRISAEIVKEKHKWEDLLSQCSKVPLLQMWEYGEAKRELEGWIPLRSVVLEGERPVGLVQALMKRNLLGTFVRINRGPLILSLYDGSYEDLYVRILFFLQRYWVEQKKTFLFIAPNIFGEHVNPGKVKEAGYESGADGGRRASILIDLSQAEPVLRKNLKQKWRNLLNKSEKMDLKLEINNSDEGISYLMEQYNRMKKEKNFSGPSEGLIRALEKMRSGRLSVEVMFTVKDSVRVSGILVVGGMDTAHYFVGWNSPAGKGLCASNFLLWHAMLFSKRKGHLWFDAGGINEKKHRGITRFKRGLGGVEYNLIGEFEVYPGGVASFAVGKMLKLARRRGWV